VLFMGIFASIFTLAGVISYLLKFHPKPLWGFFFGLVAASIFYVGKTIEKWDAKVIISFVLGAVIAFMITIAPPVQMSDNTFYVFISGAIAICAMILPGISGSFILLLMGSYSTIIFAVKDKNLFLLAVFGCGCFIGLLLFSKLLKWLFANYEKIIVSLLTGFLLGSLNKLWPWKINTDQLLVVHSDGEKEFIQHNVMPNLDSGFVWILLCIFFGFGLLFSLEFAARKLSQ
jgi:putative membrane protein